MPPRSLCRPVAWRPCRGGWSSPTAPRCPDEPQPIHFTYTSWLDSGAAEVTWGSWSAGGLRRADSARLAARSRRQGVQWRGEFRVPMTGARPARNLRPVTKIAAGIGLRFRPLPRQRLRPADRPRRLVHVRGRPRSTAAIPQRPLRPGGHRRRHHDLRSRWSPCWPRERVRSDMLENLLARLNSFADTVGALITVWLIVIGRRPQADPPLRSPCQAHLIDVLRWLMVGLGDAWPHGRIQPRRLRRRGRRRLVRGHSGPGRHALQRGGPAVPGRLRVVGELE